MESIMPASMFQPNTNDDSENDEEERADEARRKNELAENLNKYLHIDDTISHLDEISINNNNPSFNYENKDDDQPKFENEFARLRGVVIAKDNEITSLTSLVNDLRKENQKIKSDMEKRLQISDAEKEQIILTKNQTHDLLIESKTELSNLKDVVTELKRKNNNVVENNSELQAELQRSKNLVYELRQQLDNLNYKHNFHDDSATKIKDLHQAKLEVMQNQIDNLSSKLDDKETEINNLKMRFKDLERSKEILLTEKLEVINELSSKLKHFQNQYFHNSQLTEEIEELRKKNLSVMKENTELEKVIGSLHRKLENNSMTQDFSKTMQQSSQKSSESGNKELIRLKHVENKALILENEMKEVQQQFSTEIKILENEVSSYTKVKSDLEKQLFHALQDCERIKKLYINTSDKNFELQETLAKIQGKPCSKCDDQNTEVAKIKCELHEKSTEIEKLHQELTESNDTIFKLKQDIETFKLQDDLIKNLQTKSEEFEKFMKNNDASQTKIKSLAQHYATQLKTIETSFKEQLSAKEELEKELTQQLNDVKHQLQQKIDEIEALKHVIRRDREKTKEIITENQANANFVLQKQTEIILKCKTEIEKYQEILEGLTEELNAKKNLLNVESESLRVLQQQLVDLKESFKQKENSLQYRYEDLKQEYTRCKEKYERAKTTVQQYKLYSEEKEKHMKKEYERLKEGYQEEVQKLEKKITESLNSNKEYYSKKLEEIKAEYLEKFKKLQNQQRKK